MKCIIIFIVLISTVLNETVEKKECSSSIECPKGKCCVNPNTDRLVDFSSPNFHLLIGGPQLIVGRCQKRVAKKGEICQGCDCEEGTTCYRPMSGVCCPPSKCYDKDYVIQQKKYWSNCKPPTCFFPRKLN
ncbi:hypothetical protein SNEBB_002675 [Seison nebaliae]|nr:hypothetical protein SNEBB_002675 [Seison nebaliae]